MSPVPITSWCSAIALLLQAALLVAGFHQTSLHFSSPAISGVPLEFNFTFRPDYIVAAGTYIHLRLDGITSGSRDCEAGLDIGSESSLDVDLYSESGLFSAYYTEGSPSLEFLDSVLHFYTLGDLENTTSYSVVVDRSNELVSNCGHTAAANFSFYSTSPDYLRAMGTWNYTVEDIEPVHGPCYICDAKLAFFPALPRRSTIVNVSFALGRELGGGDQLIINLAGFTSGNATPYDPGPDYAMGDVVLLGGNDTWLAAWVEGDGYERDAPGYANSTLTLQVRPGSTVSAGEATYVAVSRKAGLKAQCGLPADYALTTVTVNATNSFVRRPDGWNYTEEAFDSIGAVGPGCGGLLNKCSKRGECDACLQRCTCPEGFGDEDDLVFAPDIARDCSERACPVGRSWSAVTAFTPRVDPNEGHVLAECSGVGACDRSKGACSCPSGFGGPACQRLACIRGCSGHGACRPMHQLALTADALPLSDNTSALYGSLPSAGGAWDASSAYACVCESSWAVGLGANETQQSEWFGPDCSLRRCPSGDNPDTHEDETNCHGVEADGGRGVGAVGNLCHVDCSNRGVCDHGQGVCHCFDGYYGQACGSSSALAVKQVA